MAGWQGGWARGLWRTAVALAAPPLAAALAFGVAWQSAYGSLGDWGFILGGLLLPLLLLGGHAALAARRGASLIALSALPAGLGAILAVASVGHSALEDRGVEISCLVLKVTEHTETESSMDSEGHWTSTTRTSYDHRLGCPAGGPEHLDAASRLAKEGESLAVVHDPEGKVSPRAAGDVHGWGLRTAAAVAVGAAVLLGLAGGIGEAYRKRRRRPRGPTAR
ncbi:hypothetical protein GCM10010215_42010 [Streptomyces virginiae]|uniref:DUF3592 domain-containing protein n=1 Tax=Streptomyces virginiae TaxID=1961 RepID=A0ABQ3NPH6_STRVG|nr:MULTISPECIES: hypothetical protein [Streptomyces]MBP2341517.1 hypothetical protein [Streptomyces virginiae]GGQ12608.1 hypothetical protein GCM10010215_42010 [Streptomyces virginiae]GHI14614.1 hypothetical protein Scinn_40770 [Streptomyces virginiae]GLV92887.1 hypothetical protein Slala04_43410 [Streptomyces lavendulae subsp. lavendulae]